MNYNEYLPNIVLINMGYAGKLLEKELVRKLRKKGLSFNQIKKQVDVSKDSISRWCQDIMLSPTQLEHLLHRKLTGSEKGRIKGNNILKERKKMQIENGLILGKNDVGKFTKRDRFLTGIALYAGEGTKTDGHVSFANSDPKLIKFMINWYREFCKVEAVRYRVRLWIHQNRDEKRAKRYWSKITNIPLYQFGKSYIAENKDSVKIRKKIHPYGIASVSFSNSEIHRRIMGWMSGIT